MAKLIPQLEQVAQEMNTEEIVIKSTHRPKHAIAFAQEVVDEGCDYLIAVGGDGTLNEVINGMHLSKMPQQKYPSLGLLPYGSANDFSRTAGVTSSIEELMALIRSDSTYDIDLGKILTHQDQEIRYFINVASAGLGPEVVKRLELDSSPFGPAFKYFKHIIQGFIRYVKKEVSCSSSTWKWEGPLLQMAIANGRYYGNAVQTAPEAELSDGQFQVAIFADLSIWDYLKNYGRLKKGVKIDHPEVIYQVADEVLLESKDNCGIEADGEYVGLAPATISILPKTIRFLMPMSADSSGE